MGFTKLTAHCAEPRRRQSPGFVQVQRSLAWITALLVLTLSLLSGCSGGSETEVSTAATGDGEVIIGLTDAEGDFLSYTVDVTSITLTRQDGAVVETLPLTTRVDFAQYTELTEFLTAATVPPGIYTDARMVIDYSDARIVVQNDSGDALDAIAKDAGGTTLDEMTMDVQLARDTFRIAPGIPAHITLDFDLDASNTIDFTTDPVDVIVDPILIADTIVEDPKTHRLRGLLGAVSVDESVFAINIRPFHRRVGNFGSLRVNTNDDTEWEIDGQPLSGQAGIRQLATMPTTTAVVALGELRRDRKFYATQVFAGTSVPWGDNDLLTGHIVARDGNLLTVRGGTVVRSNDSVIFNDEVMVTIGDDTKVTRQAVADTGFTIADLSVGQRVDVIGELTDNTSGDLELDATAGHVRMRFTTLRASVVQTAPLVVDVQRIDRRNIALFDFSGTGITIAEDADPDNYEIDSGALSLDSLVNGGPVKIRGFVNAFGMAPPDFNAWTVLDVQELPALMNIHWSDQGTTTPFTSQSASELVVSLNEDELGRLHHVFRADVATDLLDLGSAPTVQPNTIRRGLFAIAQNRRIQIFTDFARFEAELADRLDGATRMGRLTGSGDFEDDQALLTTHRMSVHLND